MNSRVGKLVVVLRSKSFPSSRPIDWSLALMTSTTVLSTKTSLATCMESRHMRGARWKRSPKDVRPAR
jgi:hypothetical protein